VSFPMRSRGRGRMEIWGEAPRSQRDQSEIRLKIAARQSVKYPCILTLHSTNCREIKTVKVSL